MKMLVLLMRVGGIYTVVYSIFLSVAAGVVGSLLVIWLANLLSHGAAITWQQIGIAVVAVAGSSFLDYVAKHELTQLSSETAKQIRLRLLRLILKLPYERYEQIGAAYLNSMVSDEINMLNQTTMSIPILIVGMVKVIGCGLYLLYLSPTIAGILAVVAVGIVAGYQGLHHVAFQQMKQWFHIRGNSMVVLRNVVDGMRDLSMNARRRWHYFEHVLRRDLDVMQKVWTKSRLGYQAANTFMQSSQMAIVLALLCTIALGLLDPLQVASYAVVIFYMSTSAQSIVVVVPSLSESRAILQRIHELGLDLSGEFDSLPESVPPLVASAPLVIEMQGVEYRYPGSAEERFSLGPIDLTLRSGELLFVVGGNGSGKTTLIKMLAGLYAPMNGRITVNGSIVDDAAREKYRQMFSIIFADVFLLQSVHGYMAALAEDSSLDGVARELLKKLHLQNRVAIHDGMLSSLDLSTGQRKRLALLGAYLEDRPVYIFDEWAASQDPEFRHVFYRELLPELRARGKLVVVISHDDAYYDVADRILRLDYGRIPKTQP